MFMFMRVLFLYFFFILASINVSGQFVSFDWVKSFTRAPGISYELYHIGVDQLENVYHSGNFSNTTDLDPGPGVYNISCSLSGVFITKLNQLGNFLWGANISGNRFTYITSQFTDLFGNTYITGRFSGTTDFDPGSGVYNLSVVENTNPEEYAIFILKLGVNGEFKWAKKIGEVGPNSGLSIVADNSGNVYTTGNFANSVDLDPGPGVYMLGQGLNNSFVLKLDVNGDFVFARAFLSNSGSLGYYIKLDNLGNIYVSGVFSGTTDFDPGPNVFNLTTGLSVYSSYLVKLNSIGNFVWAKKDVGGPFVVDASQNIFTFDSNLSKYDPNGNSLWVKVTGGAPFSFDLSNHISPIDIDTNGNIYINSIFRYTQDFDPGPGIYTMSTFNGGFDSDVFFSRFDNDGNFIWSKKFGSFANDIPTSIKIDAGGNIYSTGIYYGTVDFDPNLGIYSVTAPNFTNIYVHKMTRCNTANGTSLFVNSCYNYTLNNNTYNTTGTYYKTLQNISGCDSLITLHLTIDGSNDTTTATSCYNYLWRGYILTNSGFYRDTLLSQLGCSSIFNLNLTIKNKSFSTINISLCEGQDYAGYTLQGTYTDTFAATNGCDSIRTLNLTIIPKKISTVYQNICKGNSFLGYSLPGIYVDTFSSVSGCDSIRTLHLSINPVYSITINKNICEGQSFLGHFQSGTYTDKLYTVNGCDSIVITNLIVDKIPTITLGKDTTLCLGEKLFLEPGQFQTYLWQDGSTKKYFNVSDPGQYLLTVTNGCGAATAKKNVSFEKCLSLFPNVFTPNGDGKNDLFRITNGIGLKNYHLQIFNRYGERIFETNSSTKGWDGTYKNIIEGTGAFIWQCTFSEGSNTKNLKGTILLLR